MELEFWSELSQAICDVQRDLKRDRRQKYPTALIVRVHLWAVLHDRPTVWGCRRNNWTLKTCPQQLPDQSTMSRRLRRRDFRAFMEALHRRLNANPKTPFVKIVDGKPLELANHSSDPDAGWGRGVARTSCGYKLHMISSGNPMPDAFAVTGLDTCEKQMAGRMIKRVKGSGYLVGDAHYDASWLYDRCRRHDHQLVCPRPKPGVGLGHRYQSPRRLRSIQLLETPDGSGGFGQALYRRRSDIERQFSQLSCFAGGMGPLPSWVRRIWRVRNWVWAKLLINAARIRIQRSCAR
jgi:hypothetical protein